MKGLVCESTGSGSRIAEELARMAASEEGMSALVARTGTSFNEDTLNNGER